MKVKITFVRFLGLFYFNDCLYCINSNVYIELRAMAFAKQRATFLEKEKLTINRIKI